MKKVGILGSCVTRDVFDNSFNTDIENKFDVVFYNSKSSLISIVSKPLDYNLKKYIENKPKFIGRVLENDFHKGFFDRINEINEIDYFIIDFIDERYDCFRAECGGVFTRSDYLLDSGLLNDVNISKQLYRVREETVLLWKQSFDQFMEKLLQVIPLEKIILHRAVYSKEFMDKNGQEKDFDGSYNKYFN